MRILVLTNLYPPHYVGGYELRCRDVTEALQQRGHEVQVLTSNHAVEGVRTVAPGYQVSRSLRVHGFFGHPWLGIPSLRKLEAFNNARLRAAISEFKPDVVHVWNLGGISKSLIFTLQQLRIPLVFDVSDHWIARSLAHDVWLSWWNSPRLSRVGRAARTMLSWMGKRAQWDLAAPTSPVRQMAFKRIYFCSKRLKQITLVAGYPVAHGAVIHCPVDTEKYNGSVKPATQDMRRLLYAGRLSEDKGVLTALKAMLQVKDRTRLSLSIYGKGEGAYEQMLKEFVHQHSLPVTFHNATPEEMPQVYRDHDALLFTSAWEEPFALTPLEAMATGLPVIGTTAGGSAELFCSGRNSLTFAAGNADQLAAQIRFLELNPDIRQTLATAGQENVLQRLNLPIIVDQIEHYLEETLSPAASGNLCQIA
jgi:glycosyltransferase involved in cell wall biosynthesis